MHVISTWSTSSSVFFSQKLTTNALVVGKSNRIDVLALTPEGVIHKCGLDIWGTLTSLNVIKSDSQPSNPRILLTTDHPRPLAILIECDKSLSTLTVVYSLSLSTRSSRISEYFQGAVVHEPSGIAISSAYSANIKVLPLDSAILNEFDCRIPELIVLSMCFLPTKATPLPVLVMLYTDMKLRRRIIAREIDLSSREVSLNPSNFLPQVSVNEDATHVIPIEGPADGNGGVLVIGGGECQFIECVTASTPPTKPRENQTDKPTSENKRKRARDSIEGTSVQTSLPFYEVAAVAPIDEDGHRIMVADKFGRLAIIALSSEPESSSISHIRCIALGEISSPSTITYLNAGVLYVGSHFGDSQLVQLSESPRSQESGLSSFVEVIDTFKNLAPISDAVITQTEGSSQVVTCSGAYNSGSLRIVRKGADFQENAVIEKVPHVTSMWPLRHSFNSEHDDLLLVSTLYDSKLIKLSNESAMEDLSTEIMGFVSEQPTIASGNVKGLTASAFLQVTNRMIIVLDINGVGEISRWVAPAKNPITVASMNPTQIIVALQGGILVYFHLDDDLRLSENPASRTFRDSSDEVIEISALSINPIWSAYPNESALAVVSFWGSNDVSILKLPELNTIPDVGISTHEQYSARSVLLHTFGDTAPYLLVGLANGLLIVYELDKKTFQAKPNGRRIIRLGETPLTLTPCSNGHYGSGGKDSKGVVFVSGSRPSIIFLENGRVQHSPIVLKDVASAAMLHSKAYPNSLVLAAPDSLVIGRLLELHKLHIRSVHMGLDNPRRICYDPVHHAFGVAVVRAEPEAGAEGVSNTTSSFRVIDELTFETMTSVTLLENEEVTCVSSHVLEFEDEKDQYFIVGSERFLSSSESAATVPPSESRSDGRIQVYRLESSTSMERTASIETSGCVYSVNAINGNVVASIDSSVVVYQVQRLESDEPLSLVQLAKYDRGYRIANIRVQDDLVMTADAMRSLEVLRWSSGKLTLVARDHSSLWPAAMEVLDSKTIIVAEGQGNLFTYRLEGSGVGLERAGSYYLGEQVTEMRPGSLASVSNETDVQPRLSFFTATGRIGIVSELTEKSALLLTALQRNLGRVLKGPSEQDITSWRSPCDVIGFSPSESIGFIDGDFVERYLGFPLDSPLAASAITGRNSSETIGEGHDGVTRLLEQLQLVH